MDYQHLLWLIRNSEGALFAPLITLDSPLFPLIPLTWRFYEFDR